MVTSNKVLLFMMIAACLLVASNGFLHLHDWRDTDFQDEYKMLRNWRDELSQRPRQAYESQFDEEDTRPIDEAEDYEWLEDEEKVDSKEAFDKNVEKTCVHIHNAYRTRYGFLEVSTNATLVKHAAKLAENGIKSESRQYGENLFDGKKFENMKHALETAIKDWFLEICDLEKNQKGKCTVKHNLAQMLWKGVTQIGCAISKSKDGDYSVAVVYDKKPVGGKYYKNLPPCQKLGEDKKIKYDECKDRKEAFDKNVEKTCVHIHNAYRTRYGFLEVSTNATLVKHAAKLAENGIKSESRQYGENLFDGKKFENMKHALETAIKDWFLEICDLEKNQKGKCLVKHNLAQMLWKGVTQIGCAITKSKDGDYSVAVVYDEKPVGGKYYKNLPSCQKLGEDKKVKYDECKDRKSKLEKV